MQLKSKFLRERSTGSEIKKLNT